MHFREEWYADGLTLDSRDELSFQVQAVRSVAVSVSKQKQEGLLPHENTPRIVCTATAEFNVSEAIEPMLRALADRRLPGGIDVVREKDGFSWPMPGSTSASYYFPTDAEGRIEPNNGLPHEMLPQPLRSMRDQVYRELHDAASRTVRVLRWRLGHGGPHNPLRHKTGEFSFDGQKWFWDMSGLSAGGVSVELVPRQSEPVRAEVEAMIRAGDDEPLGHLLHREAAALQGENPRSALIMAVAAAEIGMKHCVAALVPDAEWLVENAPSPPLVAMLTEYLPKLPAKCKRGGRVLPPPAPIIETLKDAVSARNKTTHVGRGIKHEKLEEILPAVKDVLWLLDFYTGHGWAWSHLLPETRQQLEAEQGGQSEAS